MFGIDNSSSSNTNNRKKDFLALGEGPTDGINNSTGAAKKFSVNFSEANKNFCLSVYYSGDESYLHVNKTESSLRYRYKIWYNIFLENI